MFSEIAKPSLYLKDQSNPELEEWLKNNKPTVLKAGESLGTVKFSDARKSEKPKVVKPLPKEPKPPKPKKEPKPRYKPQQSPEKKVKIAVQAVLLKPFFDKATKADITKLCAITGISSINLRRATFQRLLDEDQLTKLREALANFEWVQPKPPAPKKKYSRRPKERTPEQIEEWERRLALQEAKKKAIAEGVKDFYAVCKNHGMTKYYVGHKNHAICYQCMKDATNKYHRKVRQTEEQRQAYDMRQRNREKMKEHAERGVMYFMGECLKHGETQFLIGRNRNPKSTLAYQSYCQLCNKERGVLARWRKKVI